MSVRDIQVFINFANFSQRFIQSFSREVILLIFIFKTIRLLNLLIKAFSTNNNEIDINSGGKANKMVMNLFNKLKNNKLKNTIYVQNIGIIKRSIFLNFDIKKTFNYLKQLFIKALIL